MSTKNNPGSFDCYANAEPDEPMFILLGRDPMGGMLVRLWARMRRSRNENSKKIVEAEACAQSMDMWCHSHGKTPVDYPITALEEEAQELFRVANLPSLVSSGSSGMHAGEQRAAIREALQRAYEMGKLDASETP